MTAKRLFGVVKGHREHIVDHTGRLYSDSEVADLLNTIHEENKQLKQYKEAIWNCNSSKIIRVNANTGEVDLIDKELKKG